MPLDGAADECQVADDVEHLVADELLRIPQRLVGQHGILADDDRILETPALDQAVLDEEFDLLVEAEGPGVTQFLLPAGRCDLEGEELGEPPPLVGAGAGDLETRVREHRHLRFADIEFDRRIDPVDLERIGLGHPAGLLDQADEFPGTAIGDRRLIGIQLDHRVVDARTGQSRQHMLHRVHLHRPLAEGGGALGVDDMLGARLDLGGAFEVDPTESQPRIGKGRQEVHRNPVSAVETDSGKRDRLFEGVL